MFEIMDEDNYDKIFIQLRNYLFGDFKTKEELLVSF